MITQYGPVYMLYDIELYFRYLKKNKPSSSKLEQFWSNFVCCCDTVNSVYLYKFISPSSMMTDEMETLAALLALCEGNRIEQGQ